MERLAQLQFAAMAPDAQRAAIRRLALRGIEEAEISRATGWSTDQIRAVLAPPEGVNPLPSALWRTRRSGSPGGSARP
jgi:hypothetical protein